MDKLRQTFTLNCYLSISLSILSLTARGQTDSIIWGQKPEISYSGYLDIFYAYDFNEPKSNYRQNFFYNHNRHNEFNLNLGLLKVCVRHLKYRANITLQSGTYVIDNYAAEPAILQHIYEGNLGLSLNKKNNQQVNKL